jgi:peptide/nickel transport system permease protein
MNKFRLASLALFILTTLVIISVFGQPFFPDNTDDANRQISELPLLKAMSQRDFIVIDEPTGTTYTPIAKITESSSFYTAEKIINPQGQTATIQIEKGKNVHIESKTFVLGTDALGRDILSRLLTGIRISILIGFFSVLVSCIVGIFVGLLAGYFGGWIDSVLMTLVNSMWSIPTILLVFALVLALGRGIENIVLAIGLTMWIDMARLVRGMTMTTKQKDYVLATKALAYKNARILRMHIFPNILDPLIVLAATNFATAILVEAGISYLGFGIQPPAPSVGIILSENYGYILGGHYIKAIAPALVVVLLVLSLNIIGSALKDSLGVESAKGTI